MGIFRHYFILLVCGQIVFGSEVPNVRHLATTIDCDFDVDMCSFNNSCSYHWTRISGSTPSVGTGPSSDHTSGSGSYVYVEASYPNYPFKGPFCLDSVSGVGINNAAFYYHMYGSDIGTLKFETSQDGSSWSTMWTKSGEQGDSWQSANINLTDSSNNKYVRFEATTGVYFDGDIALDDVVLTEMTTFAPSITPAPSFTFTPSALPTLRPTSNPSTTGITSELQLTNALLTDGVANLESDIYLSYSIYVVSVEVILNGQNYKLDGQDTVRCMVIIAADISVHNLTITNGYSADGAGILGTSESIVTFRGCLFESNAAPSGDASLGGALRLSDCTLFVYDCIIRGNYAPQGGGIALSDGGSATISNSFVIENIADDSGAGMYVEFTSLVMINTTIAHNEVRSGSGGGMIFTYDAAANITNCNISLNVASIAGGGVLVDSAPYIYFTSTLIDSNKAWLGGGFMLSSSVAQVVVDKVAITNNEVDGWSGGGVYVADGVIIKTNGVIANNTAHGKNFNVQSGNCTSVGACFSSPNYPDDYGIEESCSIEVMKNTTLDAVSFSTESGYDFLTVNSVQYSGIIGPDCEQVDVGDVITFNSDQFVVSRGFEICSLKTPNGGGMSLHGGHAYLTNTSVYGNEAGRDGGGLHVDGGSIDLVSTVVSANKAHGVGGGISFVSGTMNAVDLSLSGLIQGVSAKAATCTSSCEKGYFANCTVATTDCFVNCKCVKCPIGTASSVFHATSNTVCEKCAAGKYSSIQGAVTCVDCGVGKYATDDASEDSGGLEYQVALGATMCNNCPAGYIAGEPGLIICDHCDGGYYSLEGASNCSTCGPGTHSYVGASYCRDCPVGRYNSISASDECHRCDEGYSSDEASIVCDDAAVGFYITLLNASWQSEVCPAHATCLGADYMPIPRQSYWVDRNVLSEAGVVLPCSRHTCKGASLQNVSCWLIDSYNKSIAECDDDNDGDSLLCTQGAFGPLCGSCKDGFTYSSTSQTCIHCRDNLRYALVILGIILGLLLCTLLIVYKQNLIPKSWKKNPITLVTKQLIKEDDMIRVLFSSFQILQSVSWTTTTVLPDPFQSFLDKSSFLSFDFVKLDCLFYNADMFTTVYVWSLTPLILVFLNYVIFKVRVFCLSEIEKSNKVMRRRLVRHHLFYFLTLTYLVLPPVTRVQFEALDCMEISGGQYLRSDTSVNCNSPTFAKFVITDCHFIFLYLSVPFLWIYLLHRKIKRINPLFGDVEEILRYRVIDPGLRPIKFLFDAYRPQYWYFESIEMFRRITFVSIIPLISSKSARRSALGFFLAIFSSVLYREMGPFRRPSVNFLMQVANCAVILTFGVALAINTNLTQGTSLLGIGVSLVLVNLSVLVIAILLSMGYFYSKEKSQLLIHRKLNSKEIGSLFYYINLKAHHHHPSPSLTVTLSSSHVPCESFDENNEKIQKQRFEEENTDIDIDQNNNQLTQAQKQTNEQKKAILNHEDPLRLSEKDVTILDVLGNGSFGLVCYGKFKSTPTAVKLVSDISSDKLKLFKQEINKVSPLQHRNVIQFYGVCYGSKCVPCALFEFMPKFTLASILIDQNHLLQYDITITGAAYRPDIMNWADPLLKWAMDIARGMQYLHENNISLENGLSPQNVFISDHNVAKVNCFGLKQTEYNTQGQVKWGGKNAPISKLVPYVAPELMRGDEIEHGANQDVYSFGMLLLCMALDVSLESYLAHQWTVGATVDINSESSSNLEASSSNHQSTPGVRGSILHATSRDSEMEDIRSALQAIWNGKWHPIDDVGGFPSAPKTICDLIVLCCDKKIEQRPSFKQMMQTLIKDGTLEVEATVYRRGRGSSFYSQQSPSCSPASSPSLSYSSSASVPAPPSLPPSTPPSPVSPSYLKLSAEGRRSSDMSPRLEQRKSEVDRLAVYRRISGKQASFVTRPSLSRNAISSQSTQNAEQDIELAERNEL